MGDGILLEKRSVIGLKGYFTRTLLVFLAGLVFIFASAFFMLVLGMQVGILLPANAGEIAAAAEIARQSKLERFSGDLSPSLYNYIYFDKAGNIAASSLSQDAAEREAARYSAVNVSYNAGAYVAYADGSYCLFTWRYEVRFTNPTLQRLLPGVETVMLVVACVAAAVFVLLFVRGMGRRLGRELALVEAAGRQIAQQNLDSPIVPAAGIREFNHALQSMDDMRGALRAALLQQWQSEQQRKQEIAALVHDLKTPLTVINGNAELLLEDALSEEQATQIGFIHSAGIRAQQYVGALQQVANMDLLSGKMQPVAAETVLRELQAALAPLAQKKAITLTQHGEAPQPIQADAPLLTRALINIGQNAVQYTAHGGQISITVRQSRAETAFIIQDGGEGFSKAALQHAKEMLWQQDKSRTGTTNYGIGLAIADKVAQKHGGALLLKNTAAGGCVTLTVKNQP